MTDKYSCHINIDMDYREQILVQPNNLITNPASYRLAIESPVRVVSPYLLIVDRSVYRGLISNDEINRATRSDPLILLHLNV